MGHADGLPGLGEQHSAALLQFSAAFVVDVEEAELALVTLVGQACPDLVAERALGRLGVVVAGERVAVAPNLRLPSLLQGAMG